MLPAHAVVALSFGVARAEGPAYHGQQTREVKALSEADTADLLAKRGVEMARAAELNHYPGLAYVLELKRQRSADSARINKEARG